MNNYSVYYLYTKIEGIFYIGYGKAAHNDRKSYVSGTASEWKKQRTKILNTSMKWRYIRACEAWSIPIYREVVYSCETKQRAEEVRYALIQVRWEERSAEQAKAAMLAQGLPPDVPDRLLGYWSTISQRQEPATTSVEQVLGRPVLTFAQWAVEHAAFRS